MKKNSTTSCTQTRRPICEYHRIDAGPVVQVQDVGIAHDVAGACGAHQEQGHVFGNGAPQQFAFLVPVRTLFDTAWHSEALAHMNAVEIEQARLYTEMATKSVETKQTKAMPAIKTFRRKAA